MFKRFVLVMISSLIIGNFGLQPSLGADFDSSLSLYQPNEILVKFKNDSKIHKILLDKDENVKQALVIFGAMENVEFAEPNYLVKTQALVPIDPDFNKQWYLEKIKASEAWERTTGQEDVVIAVLDTGVDLGHPDIANNLWVNENEIPNDGIDNDGNIYVDDVQGWDFVDGDNDPSPNFDEWYTREGIDHGTVVAGIAAAVGNNGEGIAGVSWHSKIMPLRVLNSQGVGDVLTIIEAIDYAVEQKVDVINLSFIGAGFSRSLFLSLERAYDAGILVVAACGNEEGGGQDLDVKPFYPVCYYGQDEENVVLGVAALDREDKKTPFSNYGSKCVDISAPGIDFWSTQVQDEEADDFSDYYGGSWSGTSVSAPLVSGTAALIKSLNPTLTVDEIRDLIVVNADPIDAQNPEYAGKLGGGRLNVARTIEAAYLTKETSQSKGGEGYILTAPGKDYSPLVKIFEDSSFVKSITAYSENFRGGVNVTSGDLNGDGYFEIVSGTGSGGGPHVRIFKEDGTLIGGFFAYAKTFRGGVNVAAGDVDGDGKDEIITGAGLGGGPHVRIFKEDGTPIGGFFAYAKTFRGGVNIAAGDTDGDGKDEIITGPGEESAPEIRVFDFTGYLKDQFSVFDLTFRGGVNVAAGDTDGDGKAEIIAGQADGGSQVRVFGQYLVLKSEFSAYENFLGGVNVAAGDVDGDGKDEIIAGTGPGGGPHVKVFNIKGVLQSQFFAYEQDYTGGVKVGFLE